MGLFGKKKKTEDFTEYGPLNIVVKSIGNKSADEMTAFCEVKSGCAGLGETLNYFQHGGNSIHVTLRKVEAMMMTFEKAAQGLNANMTFSGNFEKLEPKEGDYITR